jgi:hypothetical protein
MRSRSGQLSAGNAFMAIAAFGFTLIAFAVSVSYHINRSWNNRGLHESEVVKLEELVSKDTTGLVRSDIAYAMRDGHITYKEYEFIQVEDMRRRLQKLSETPK